MKSWLSSPHERAVVARDVCPPPRVPLTLGFRDEEGIICPYHGLRFGEDGRCNRIPPPAQISRYRRN